MDAIPPGESTSLAARLGAALRGVLSRRPAMRAGKREWWVAGAVGALIAAGPVATIVGANLLTGHAQGEVRQLSEKAAPRVAAEQAAGRDRAELVALLRRPGVGATVEALARVLPADSSLARIGRGRDGLLESDVTTPDPDALRAAIRREPALARLRDAGQQRGELTMTVSLREARQ